MSSKHLNRKGQLSLDLAFAIIMVLIVATMIVDYWVSSETAAATSSKLMGINTISEYAASNLNEFYNSLDGFSGKAMYVLVSPADFSQSSSASKFNLNYTLTLQSDRVVVTDTISSQTASTDLPFTLDCASGSLPMTKNTLEEFELSGCEHSGSRLDCDSCS